MADSTPHPDWLAVGSPVRVVRRLGRAASHTRGDTVARHTRTLVILTGGDRFRRDGSGRYVETPAYLDYTTTLERPDA